MTSARAAALLAVLVMLSACSSTSAGSVPERTMEPTSMPSPGIAEIRASSNPLPPGRYTRSSFEPSVSFELDGSWYGVQIHDGFFDVQQEVGSPDVIAVQFARPSAVYASAGQTVDVATAREAMDGLVANLGFLASDVSDIQIGSLTGLQMTLENAGTVNAAVMLLPPGPLSIAPERRLQVIFADTRVGLLAILVGGSVARWDAALHAAAPVLASIAIGP